MAQHDYLETFLVVRKLLNKNDFHSKFNHPVIGPKIKSCTLKVHLISLEFRNILYNIQTEIEN